MALSSIFKIRKEATPALLELLNNTTLGTNGAKYRHLDTTSRILEADNPLFLSMERNNKVIGNVTFCQRDKFWYIRYFAFHSFTQAGNKKKNTDKGNSFLKRELNQFFDEVFEGKHSDEPVESMYAYIDPRNDRSKWMSENFGFKVISQLATQSFSRFYPKLSPRVELISDWNEIKEIVEKHYNQHNYFFLTHAKKAPFYVLKDANGEILAFTRVTKVNWEIVRLPGKMGGLLTKIIPFIPFLMKLIKPKNHIFLVPEIVFSKDSDPNLLEELFSSILAQEKCNLILWWIDGQDPLYRSIKDKMHWGFFNKLIGVNPVDVVERRNPTSKAISKGPVFVTAFDMV
ncbi:MAG: hypothetical protein RI883_369 [Bacteroidota bacterium]|jgi:hypothetical protein